MGAVTVDPQTPSYDPSPLKQYLSNLGVPYFYESQCKYLMWITGSLFLWVFSVACSCGCFWQSVLLGVFGSLFLWVFSVVCSCGCFQTIIQSNFFPIFLNCCWNVTMAISEVVCWSCEQLSQSFCQLTYIKKSYFSATNSWIPKQNTFHNLKNVFSWH